MLPQKKTNCNPLAHPTRKCNCILVQSFTARMPLLKQPVHSHSGEDAVILPNNVIYTIQPQNGECFMTTDSVTSLRPIYKTLLTEW